MSGMVWVDGQAYRWCGPAPAEVPAAEQVSVAITPCTTAYVFSAGGVELDVEFASAFADVEDLALTSEEVATITFAARSNDGREHEVRTYVDLSGEWCTNSSGTLVQWSRHRVEGLDVVRMGSVDQPVLRHAGDRRRIDWGFLYLATPIEGATVSVGADEVLRGTFAGEGKATASDDLRSPRAVSDQWPVLGAVVDLGKVGADGRTGFVLIGYDEGRAIEYFERPLASYWRYASGDDFAEVLLRAAERARSGPARDAAARAERELMDAATRVGGEEYAALLALTYRQVLGGHKIVADWDGTPLMFSKEITSNGCIATVDVIYPASPFFLYHNPAMLRAQLRPLLDYAASPRWKFPFAPHDLGTYPKANGQVYGGGEHGEENQMPVEESGNMLILLAALAKAEGTPEFSLPYLEMLESWAVYLREHGLDPVHQLCTDDFAGHLARNANLSAKTCVALGAYAQLLDAAGKPEDGKRWRAVAEDFAKRWVGMANGPEATVLVFSDEAIASGEQLTWSQKYNLVWDRVLGLELIPQEVVDREMAWYRTRLNTYGLPLDSRRAYTKTDWTAWSACLTGRRDDFDAIMGPVYAWAQASPPPSRVPLSDWYETTDGVTRGMHTRTVVGGLWMPLLLEKMGAGWDGE